MPMTIGALARRSGVHVETIRYYERIGLIPKAERMPNGRRRYSERDAQRLSIVRHARELGFEVATIRVLLALQQEPDASCKEIAHVAQAQLEATDQRIARLRALRAELARMLKACSRGRVAECRIVAALSTPAAS